MKDSTVHDLITLGVAALVVLYLLGWVAALAFAAFMFMGVRV